MLKELIILVAVILLVFSAYFLGSTQRKPPETNNPNAPGMADSKSVDLSRKNLTVFPPDVLQQSQITWLNLSSNRLKTLPSEIGNLSNLEELYLDHNQLEGALPAEIRKMSKLRVLNVQNNRMTGIPAEIGQLKNLSELNYSYNNLDTFPNEIGNLKDNLKKLDISYNRYSEDSYKALMLLLPNTDIIY